MERVQDSGFDTEVYRNDIELYLAQFCEEQQIKDLKKESQNVWNAALMYVRRNAFPTKDILKLETPLTDFGNCNAYDIKKVDCICNIYIYLAYLYDKEVSIMGFSKLTGINNDTIQDWGKNINKLSRDGCAIYQKLTAEREESLTSKLVSLKHPTAFAIMLNKHYGYNLPGVTKENIQSKAETAEQIGAKYGVKLPDDSGTDALPMPPE